MKSICTGMKQRALEIMDQKFGKYFLRLSFMITFECFGKYSRMRKVLFTNL